MLRTSAARSAYRAVSTASPLSTTRAHFALVKNAPKLKSQLTTLANGRQTAVARPLSMAVSRYMSTTTPRTAKIDTKHEIEYAKSHKLTPHPEYVSTSSSTHGVFSEVATEEKHDDVDMMAGIKSDLKTIRETFSLQEVPKEAIYVGIAGVVPYLATSLSTVYCAWEINHAYNNGVGFLISERTAELLLHVLEPLQIGWGAVIISFLGAIHWGLEWANYGGVTSYRRYAIGMIAPAVAWPSILLPAETALIVQFLAFNFLYYADSRATKRGLAPPWYGVYRFVLTFIVGSSIVVSLIGRGHVGDRITKASGPADRIRALRDSQEEELLKEEEARRQATVAAEESDEDEDED